MYFAAVIAVLLSNILIVDGQTCGTLADGCNGGNSHDAAVKGAIARFDPKKVYGGQEPIVFSSNTNGGTSLASISYTCSDGSVPQPVSGSTIQSRLQSILSCPNQCGSIPVTTGSNCGFGILIADSAASETCFSKALNVVPEGRSPTEKPAVGVFKSIGCWTDGETRTLTGGSANDPDMTLEKCIALAHGFKYAAVEYSTECHWGNVLASTGSAAPGQCDMPCGGSPLDLCGGGWLLSVYQDSSINPVVVPAVGSHNSLGCYVDSAAARVLNAGTQAQYGEGGMTVEKCIELSASYRYAGVQYYGECFWGDIPTQLVSSSLADCNTPCDGDHGEYCGGGNRLNIYEDMNWVNPTRDALAAKIQEYIEFMGTLRDAIQNWSDLLDQYSIESTPPGALKARFPPSAALVAVCKQAQADILYLRPRWAALGAEINELFKIASRYEKISLSESQNWDEMVDTVFKQFEAIGKVGFDAFLTTGIAVVRLSLEFLGTKEGLGLALFFLAWKLFRSLKGIELPGSGNGNGNGNGNPTGQPTTTATATSTTSSSTATATPYVVFTKPGTSVSDFHAMINSLEADTTYSHEVVYPNLNWQLYSNWLTAAQVKLVEANPVVDLFAQNQRVLDAESAGDFESTPELDTRSITKRSEAPGLLITRSTPTVSDTDDGNRTIVKRAMITQPVSPDHLKLLSRASTGDLDTQDFMYDDTVAGAGVTIYAIDTGFREFHQEFRSNTNRQFRTEQTNLFGPTKNDEWNHGTTILSVAAGRRSGAAKNANIVGIKMCMDKFTEDEAGNPLPPVTRPQFDLASISTAFMYAINDHIGRDQLGGSVINLSIGVLRNDDEEPALRTLLNRVYDADIVFVTSAGNEGIPIDSYSIKNLGGANTPMIVVGGVSDEGVIWSQSNVGNQITIYAKAIHNYVATNVNDNSYGRIDGTSQAAGTVSGLAAYFLSDPALATRLHVQGQVARRVKLFIIATAMARTLPAPADAPGKVACNGARLTDAEAGYRDGIFGLLAQDLITA